MCVQHLNGIEVYDFGAPQEALEEPSAEFSWHFVICLTAMGDVGSISIHHSFIFGLFPSKFGLTGVDYILGLLAEVSSQSLAA